MPPLALIGSGALLGHDLDCSNPRHDLEDIVALKHLGSGMPEPAS